LTNELLADNGTTTYRTCKTDKDMGLRKHQNKPQKTEGPWEKNKLNPDSEINLFTHNTPQHLYK